MKLENKTKRTAANSWIERMNPLRGLTIAQAKGIYDIARAHGSPLLQKIYDEIEASDPILMTCVERRGAALAQLGWKITAKPGFDDAVADRHKAFLDRAVRSIDNLDSAIEHLDLAFFRGFSFVQPIWQGNTVTHVNLLNSWNFLRDDEGRYMWNPEASTDPAKCDLIVPAMRLVSLVRRRAIDWPALSIHIRKYLGERDWGRFIERYGIPPVDVVMAPNATEKQRDDYVAAGDDARDGRSTVWPSGSTITRAEGARGQDPFSAFIEHQEKLIVLAATGGTLTSLAQADTGSLAGGAQMDVWQQIVARDAVMISEALQRNLFDPMLRRDFPGEEPSAEFSIGTEEKHTAGEAADLAGKLKVAGYTVAQDELEEAVGYTLAPVPEVPPAPLGLMQNKETEVVVDSGSGRKDDQLHSTTTTHDYNSSILSAFAADNSKLADAINLFLKTPTPEEAQDLIDALPDLVPDDPALAAVIAEEMAKAMRPDASAPSDAELANKVANTGERAHCPEDGGWIGDAGCTHPNHTHSELVNKIIEAAKNKKPITISPEECDRALQEGFYVDVGNGKRIGFGKSLAEHFDEDHDKLDEEQRKNIQDRKTKLMFAVDAVMHPTRIGLNEEGHADRKSYIKEYKDFGVKAVSSEEGDKIEYVFTFFHNRSMRKK